MGKTLIGILIALIIIPALVLGGLYYFSDSFKMTANDMLSELPGGIGEYFSSFATVEELAVQIKEIAEYLVEIDVDRAADKLELIANDDTAMYEEVVKNMIRIDPNATEDVLEVIRSRSLKTNIVMSTLDQIDEERNKELEDKATYLTELSLVSALGEIKKIIDEEVTSYKYLSSVFGYMTDDKVVDILTKLDPVDVENIMNYFSEEQRDKLLTIMANNINNSKELKNTADIIRNDSILKLVDRLGNENTYKLDDLITLYIELGALKTGEILSKVNDDTFVHGVINGISDKLILEYGDDYLTEDILKTLKVYKDYDDNIRELVKIYSNISDEKTADYIKELYWKTGVDKKYPLSNGDVIEFTGEDIALDLLASFNSKKVASILSSFDNNLATEISTRLALPNF